MWWSSKRSTPAASPNLPIAPCSMRPNIDSVPMGLSISAAMLPSPSVPTRVFRLCTKLLQLQAVIANKQCQSLQVAL